MKARVTERVIVIDKMTDMDEYNVKFVESKGQDVNTVEGLQAAIKWLETANPDDLMLGDPTGDPFDIMVGETRRAPLIESVKLKLKILSSKTRK